MSPSGLNKQMAGLSVGRKVTKPTSAGRPKKPENVATPVAQITTRRLKAPNTEAAVVNAATKRVVATKSSPKSTPVTKVTGVKVTGAKVTGVKVAKKEQKPSTRSSAAGYAFGFSVKRPIQNEVHDFLKSNRDLKVAVMAEGITVTEFILVDDVEMADDKFYIRLRRAVGGTDYSILNTKVSRMSVTSCTAIDDSYDNFIHKRYPKVSGPSGLTIRYGFT